MYGPSLLASDNSLLQTDGQGGADGGIDETQSGGNATDLGAGGSVAGSGEFTTLNGGTSNAAGGDSGSVSAGTAGEVDTVGGSSGSGDSGGSAQGGSGTPIGSGAQGGSSTQGSSGSSSVAPHDLSTGKPATASTQQTGNEVSKGNDGNYSSRWCGADDTVPQWWRVDLGAPHLLSTFSVAFQLASRTYTYNIETSTDDAVYVRRSTITGTGAVQNGSFPAGVTARYVRITVTAAPPVGTSPTWASFYEFVVQGS